jgi:hypothetical protein
LEKLLKFKRKSYSNSTHKNGYDKIVSESRDVTITYVTANEQKIEVHEVSEYSGQRRYYAHLTSPQRHVALWRRALAALFRLSNIDAGGMSPFANMAGGERRALKRRLPRYFQG